MATATEQMTDGAQSCVGSSCEDFNVEEVLAQLDRELVGLKPVKTRIREVAALLMVDKLRKGAGLTSEPPSLHMSFTGNPGTGKTTVALRMAEILHRLGYIRRPEVITVTRDDLVGQYIGHTAPKTKAVLKRAMGGVLFIDEAYYLYRPENERDYGQESIEILLQVMENNRDDLVVILAGYSDRMATFFSSNPGMSSRIAHHLEFPDFAVDELAQITQLMLKQQQYHFSKEAEQVFYQYIQKRTKMPHFANARSIRNALDRARLRQANRLYARGGTLTRDELMTIEAEDVLASRVFQESKPDGLPDQIKNEIQNPIHIPIQIQNQSRNELRNELQEEMRAEKKISESVRDIDQAVTRPPDARHEMVSQQHHDVIQDNSIMQTDMKMNESAQHNSSSADAGFGGMQHNARPPTQPASHRQNRSKAAPGARVSPPPRREAWRDAPPVVNGRCEFGGQCEHETAQESTAQEVTAQRPPAPAYMGPASLAGQAADCTDEAGCFGVPRDAHPPRVIVVRRGANKLRNKASRDRMPPPLPQINRSEPVVVNGRCEFGQCEAPPKVEETATTGGQIVTGTNVERSSKVTGNEAGSCKKITGNEYSGPDQYAALCASGPYVPPAKVGVTHTVGRAQRVTGTEVGHSSKMTGDERGASKRVSGIEYLGAETQAQLSATPPPSPAPKVGTTRTAKNKTVTGTMVGTSSKMTGDELGSCKHVTGDEYLNPATADVPCATEQSPGPAKVNVSRTTHGRKVTGTLVGGSPKMTGDEYGACHGITGTEYIGSELQKELCGTQPLPSPAKVGLSRTWRDQQVSGTQVGRSEKVTGDEFGACETITGTPYVGRDRYEKFCAPRDVAASAARVVLARPPAGHAMTGIQPSVRGKMTGDERGACLNVSGTPYVGDDQFTQACDSAGAQGVQATADKSGTFSSGAFSLTPPTHATHGTHATRTVTGTAYDGATRITGPMSKAMGVMTGTEEFRHPAYRETLVAPAPEGEKTDGGKKTEAKSRVTGEGIDTKNITGDDWSRNERVTGTEGVSARRNPTLRGDQRGVVMSAKQNKERERPKNPVSKITGSSGNSATGNTITYSGGARG